MLLHKNEYPEWFEYPSEFELLIDQNLLDFDPWIILTGDRLKKRFFGLKERYPSRDLVPFARREDNDDLACWEKGKEVVVIHDFASSGNERGESSISFWSWFRQVIEDMIEHNS